MKKNYESPKSLTVVIGLHGRLLDSISQGNDGEQPGYAREHSNVWDDDAANGGKKVIDEEW